MRLGRFGPDNHKQSRIPNTLSRVRGFARLRTPTMRMCCKCGVAPAARQDRSSYCLPCHAAHTREWRRKHPYHTLPAVTRFKSTMRSYANVYMKRGKLLRCPCYFCGDQVAEKHHPDYSEPLLVIWLCRDCHLQIHQFEIPGVGNDVEQIALQWDAMKNGGVKRTKKLFKQQMEARKQSAKIRTHERENKKARRSA